MKTMDKKEIYSKPEIEIIEVEMANVIASSPLDVSDDVHPGGDSMSNGFWESGYIN